MTYLQCNIRWRQLAVDAMEVADGEILLVGRLRVVAMRHVDDILLRVFLDDEPRAATQSHPLTLSDGVEPMAFVLPDLLASLQFYQIAR